MKNLFLDVSDKLEADVPELAWIDEDMGQMNFDQPPVLFPCALTSISTPRRTSFNDKQQDVNAQLRLSLYFNYKGNTNHKTPTAARAKSLEYYDLVEKIKNTLHGFGNANFQTLDCVNITTVPRPDQYKQVVLVFATNFMDTNGA